MENMFRFIKSIIFPSSFQVLNSKFQRKHSTFHFLHKSFQRRDSWFLAPLSKFQIRITTFRPKKSTFYSRPFPIDAFDIQFIKKR